MKKLASLKLKNHGFSIVETIVGLALVAAIVGVGLYVYTANSDSNEQANTGEIHKEQSAAEREAEDNQPLSKVDEEPCREDGTIRYCIELSEKVLSNLESVELTSTLTNVTQETLVYSFGCTNTEPLLFINDEFFETSSLCATAITDVMIEPNETIEYTYKLRGSDLKQGESTIQTKWQDFESNILAITREDDESKAAEYAQECLDGQYNPTCKAVTVFFKESIGDVTCDRAQLHVDELDIVLVREDQFGQSYCDTDNLLFAKFYVPGDDLDQWVEKLDSLPEVELAGSSGRI